MGGSRGCAARKRRTFQGRADAGIAATDEALRWLDAIRDEFTPFFA